MEDDASFVAGHPPERHTVAIDGTRLSYLQWGRAGTPLVLLHGITSDARVWWRVAPAFAAQGFVVRAFDLPGHGLSDTVDVHRIDQLAMLLDRAIAGIEPGAIDLIGHSWGGAISLALAALVRPQRVRRAALLDPAVRMDPAHGASVIDRYALGIGDAVAVSQARLRAENPLWHDADVYWKALALAHCRRSAVEGLFTGSGQWDLAPWFAQLAVPTLLLLAEADHTVVPADALAQIHAAAATRPIRVRTAAGATHQMQRVAFDAVMAELVPWQLAATPDLP